MLYTDNYELNLPQTSDAVRVEDLNENTTAIDGLLAGMEISDITAAEIWGGNSVPDNVTISGAFSKVAQTVPATMGTPGTLLMAGSGGASWSKNHYYADLIHEESVSMSGNVAGICQIPTGWSVENLTGIVVEGDFTMTGAYNSDSSSSRSCYLMMNGALLSIGTVYFQNYNSYDTSKVDVFSFRRAFQCTSLIDGQILVGPGSETSSNAWTSAAANLYVEDGVVTSMSGGTPGFYGYWQSDYEPYANSVVGTFRVYALREVE